MNFYEVYNKKSGHLLVQGNAENCAKSMGITRSGFYTLVFQNKDAKEPKYNIIVKNKRKPNRVMNNYYTIYERDTQEVVASGNAEECAKKMNRSLHSFYSMVTRVRKEQNKKYEIEIELLPRE